MTLPQSSSRTKSEEHGEKRPGLSASAVLAGSMLGTTHFGAIWSHLRGCPCRHVHAHWILGMYYVVWHPSGACQARYPLARKWRGRWNISGIDFCLGTTMFRQAKHLVFWQMLGYMVVCVWLKTSLRLVLTIWLTATAYTVLPHPTVMCAEALESMVQTWSGTLVVEDVRVNFAIFAAVGAWRSPVKDSSIKMKILCAHEVVTDMEAP
ncbi:hypothetical protein EDC04DRAFT_3090121 [Pisolithus marmoratus]|nr:hypothetical protein EDC04DRAFT_3090121 [Pisolithus marmoratus]